MISLLKLWAICSASVAGALFALLGLILGLIWVIDYAVSLNMGPLGVAVSAIILFSIIAGGMMALDWD